MPDKRIRIDMDTGECTPQKWRVKPGDTVTWEPASTQPDKHWIVVFPREAQLDKKVLSSGSPTAQPAITNAADVPRKYKYTVLVVSAAGLETYEDPELIVDE